LYNRLHGILGKTAKIINSSKVELSFSHSKLVYIYTVLGASKTQTMGICACTEISINSFIVNMPVQYVSMTAWLFIGSE